MRMSVQVHRLLRASRLAAWGLPLAIVALALLLRMAFPTLVEFKYDEANVVRRALAIAYEGDRPAVGAISSVGTFHPPLHLYLAALPLRLWPDPVALVLFLGFLGGVAVWMCYLLGRTYLGRDVGLIAAYLFAVNSWSVYYTRKIWTQNNPLVTVLFFMALLAFVVQGRAWALSGAFLGAAALISLHLGGLAFVPVLVLALFMGRRRLAWRPLALGVVLFGLLLAPYFIHDARHGWEKVRGFLEYTGGEAHFSTAALRYAFLLTGSKAGLTVVGGNREAYLAGLPNLWWLDRVAAVCLALALVYALVEAVRGDETRRRTLLVLLLWFWTPVLLQSRPTRPIYPHYFILLFPVQFLLIAFLLVDGGRRLPDWRLSLATKTVSAKRLVLVAGLLVWGAWNIAALGRLWFVMEAYPKGGGYGAPLKYTRQAAHTARALAADGEVVVLTDGLTPFIDEAPTLFEALLFNTPHRFANGAWALPLPEMPTTVYLVGEIPPDAESVAPLLDGLAAWHSPRAHTALVMPGGWAYEVWAFSSDVRTTVWRHLTRFPRPLRLANGVTFEGYTLRGEARPGNTLEVWLAWRVHQAQPTGVEYHFFVHLLDEGGARHAQHDGTGFPAYAWRVGDLVLSRFVLTLPPDLTPGRYVLWAGMYTYPDVVNVAVVDEAGNAVDAGVWLGDIFIE
ncbi:hypothetical protein SE16_09740 [Ardenticatena maritima]|uniref:Glycosyltransferase RgtA/B/C/D-like domain-containing protein n=2 Tax=Ardenticatena maritima TaxID=872965 RepID=A0A0N8GRY9_9CHLR|nr:hypothetical protein SE16_09740 [Ardenticatena maritima]